MAMSKFSLMLLNDDGEVVVRLADGWTLRSGVYDQNDPGAFTSGEYVRLVDPFGEEYCYWDQEEWATDPALVMGAIINSAAGLRILRETVDTDACCECGDVNHTCQDCPTFS